MFLRKYVEQYCWQLVNLLSIRKIKFFMVLKQCLFSLECIDFAFQQNEFFKKSKASESSNINFISISNLNGWRILRSLVIARVISLLFSFYEADVAGRLKIESS